MDGDYRPNSESQESRLRARILAAHLKVADAGGHDAALIKLVEIVRGQTVDGKAIKVSPRTQSIAAARLAQLGIAVLPMQKEIPPAAPPAPPAVDQSQHVHLHLHEGAPKATDDKRAWLDEYARALAEQEAQRIPSPAAESPGAAHETNGHEGNGHATPEDGPHQPPVS